MNQPPPDAPTIRLDDLLKLVGAVDSGGQAKALVQGGKVKVNGEVDTRRGRKLVSGDRVTMAGSTFDVDAALNENARGKAAHKELRAPKRRALTPYDRPEPPKVGAPKKRAKPKGSRGSIKVGRRSR
jgi:ribosome-associated protein